MQATQTDLHFGNYFGCGLPEEALSLSRVRPTEKSRRRTGRGQQDLPGNYFGCGFPYMEGVEDAGDSA